ELHFGLAELERAPLGAEDPVERDGHDAEQRERDLEQRAQPRIEVRRRQPEEAPPDVPPPVERAERRRDEIFRLPQPSRLRAKAVLEGGRRERERERAQVHGLPAATSPFDVVMLMKRSSSEVWWLAAPMRARISSSVPSATARPAAITSTRWQSSSTSG